MTAQIRAGHGAASVFPAAFARLAQEALVTDITETIRRIVARHAEVALPEVDETASFDSLSIDSFTLMEIVLDIEDALSIQIPDARLDAITDLPALIAECRAQRGV
jgi:acyl carrier protein